VTGLPHWIDKAGTVWNNPHIILSRTRTGFMPTRPARLPALSRREREVLDILFRRGQATAAEVMADIQDPPTYSSVRSILAILVEKGHVVHREEGLRYVYLPAKDVTHFRDEALRHVIRTFFGGSADQTIAAVLKLSDSKISEQEIARLQAHIRRARSKDSA
jgi:predicted transcriptional regulator